MDASDTRESFASWLELAWTRHATQSSEVALEIETRIPNAVAPSDAVALIRLSNHTLGEHLHEWARAARCADQLSVHFGTGEEAINGLVALVVAQTMAARADDAAATRELIGSRSPTNANTIDIRIAAEVAKNRIGLGDAAGFELYRVVLERARGESSPASDRAVGVASNNLAGDLLDRPMMDQATEALMVTAAEASLEFWKKCGTWVNEERALMMLATVHNRIGDAARARHLASKALEVIENNGGEPIDEAFLQLVLVRSARMESDANAERVHLARAEELATAFDDPGLLDYYVAEKAKALAAI